MLIVKILEICQNKTLSIFSDSQYVVQVHVLPFSQIKERLTTFYLTMITLHELLWQRAHPWYFSHIRSHLGLPSALTQGMIAQTAWLWLWNLNSWSRPRHWPTILPVTTEPSQTYLRALNVSWQISDSCFYAICIALMPLGPLNWGQGTIAWIGVKITVCPWTTYGCPHCGQRPPHWG